MKIKRYLAGSLPEAMALVRQELGPDAIILGTRRLKVGGIMGMFGRRVTEVTTASGPITSPGAAAPGPSRVVTPQAAGVSLPAAARPLRPEAAPGRALRASAVPERTRGPGEAGDRELAPVVRPGRASSFGGGPGARPFIPAGPRTEQWGSSGAAPDLGRIPACRPIRPGGRCPQVVTLVGPSGCGKTTTAVKLAGLLSRGRGLKVALVGLDVRVEHGGHRLRAVGRALGVEVRNACTAGELGAVIEELEDRDVVLVDTPGLNFRDPRALQELGALLEGGGGEVHLVLALNLAEGEARQAAQAFSRLGFDRLIFTKADEAQGYGLMFSLAGEVGVPVSYVCSGQRVPEDIEEATPAGLAALLVGSVASAAAAWGG
ncbi:MAG: hypothetical protein K6T75_08500 [Acetobacteraceae bacterium]|nr:hypothetical protein [Acetobacteraceae bacterium]